MKIKIKIITYSLPFLLLSACSTVIQTEPVKVPQTIKSSTIWESEPLKEAYLRIQKFKNADPKTVLIPYALGITKIASIEEQNVCNVSSINLYETLFKLNPSSLIATSLLYGCEVGTAEESSGYLRNYNSTIQVLLMENNGSSINNAVQIRDLNEALFILETAGYEIIDYEIIDKGNKFIYKFHTISGEGKFEHHYYENFAYFKRMFGFLLSSNNDKLLKSKIILKLANSDDAGIINYISSKFMRFRNYKNVISQLSDKKTLYPISRLNLARSYLYTNQLEKIDELLEGIIKQKESGDIYAAAFLTELFIKLNGKKSTQTQVNSLLDEIDSKTVPGEGALLLAKNYYKIENEAEFKYWTKKAFEKNKQRAFKKTSKLLSQEKDHEGLIKFLTKQSDLENFNASFKLASIYREGEIVKADHKKELELLFTAAKKGHVDSMYELGLKYYYGENLPKDAKLALKWYLMAAENGKVKAYNEVGMIYHKNLKGVGVNFAKAKLWYERSIKEGYGVSAGNLGILYKNGQGVDVNYEKAKKYYNDAIELGYIKAYELMGDLYQYNLGSEYNQKALEFYQKGADLNHLGATYELAKFHSKYIDDEAKTIELYQKIYESDDAEKINWSANTYSNGAKYFRINLLKAIIFYKRAAKLGNSSAQVNLGFHYETGNAISEDLEKARVLYEKSAAQNNDQGINNLATFYRDGAGGLEIDIKKSIELYQKASRLNNNFAHKNLADLYFEGEHLKQDYDKAFELYKKAADDEFSNAYYDLAYSYQFGYGTKKNTSEAIKYYTLGMKDGNEDSALGLAYMYSDGDGVTKNQDKAIDYLRQAAKMDSYITNENYYIGNVYFLGQYNFTVNYQLANKYLSKAADQGYSAAMNNLAEIYRYGNGVVIDYKKAIKLYRKAVKANSSIAKYNLAQLYRDGDGVVVNEQTSFEWMLDAAQSGFYNAIVDLSTYYLEGYGTKQDVKKAINWLEVGVKKDYSDAQYKLALLLYKGENIEKDIPRAKILMKAAADNGSSLAQVVIKNNYNGL